MSLRGVPGLPQSDALFPPTPETQMTHQVVAPTVTGSISVMKSGTRSQCETYIRQRIRQNLPTHFCYVIGSSQRAWDMFRKRMAL